MELRYVIPRGGTLPSRIFIDPTRETTHLEFALQLQAPLFQPVTYEIFGVIYRSETQQADTRVVFVGEGDGSKLRIYPKVVYPYPNISAGGIAGAFEVTNQRDILRFSISHDFGGFITCAVDSLEGVHGMQQFFDRGLYASQITMTPPRIDGRAPSGMTFVITVPEDETADLLPAGQAITPIQTGT